MGIREKNIRGKEDNFIIIKESIDPEDITVLKIYAPNNRVSKQMK